MHPLLRRGLAATASAGLLAGLAAAPAQAQDTPVLSVDFGRLTGAPTHGAIGSLYGISESGVPGDNLLDALAPSSMAAKPTGGTQHPNGDANDVLAALAEHDGGDAYVNLQDWYPDWPYQNDGIDAYLAEIDEMVPVMEASEHADRLVYVPFNEPNWIWYPRGDDYEGATERFFHDWDLAYAHLREIAPDTPIAGPNESHYDRQFMRDFMEHTAAAGTVPDVITWHELSPDSLRYYQGNFDHYRALEAELGLEPRLININEYGNNRDFGMPGQMVQWASMFEDTDAIADMAYWTASGGFSGNAPQTNVPNGGWWFLKTYSQMTGQTAEVTPPQADTVDTLQGIATYDESKEQAQILLGGGSGDTTVDLTGLDLGRKVTATVHEIAWTGNEGSAAPPRVIDQIALRPDRDGSSTVELSDLDPMSAYWITLTPGTGRADGVDLPWTGTWEAEDAAITAGTVYNEGGPSNAFAFPASGGKSVGSLNRADSRVDFTVDVPEAGTYDLTVTYGNTYGRDLPEGASPTEQFLTVNGGPAATVTYPSTMQWGSRGQVTVQVELEAGENTLALAKSDTESGTAYGEAGIDKIDLALSAVDTHTYPAVFARTEGDVDYRYGRHEGVEVRGDEQVVFDVYAPADGYYEVAVDADGEGELTLVGPHGENAAFELEDEQTLALSEGVNRIALGADGRRGLEVHDLTVTGDGGEQDFTRIAAADADLAGTAQLTDNPWAADGEVVTGVGGGEGNTATLTVEAEEAGPHLLLVHYANDERSGNHDYNIDIISRYAEFTVNGDAVATVPMRGTWSWNDFWSYPLVVDLEAGTNTIEIGNSGLFTDIGDREGRAADFDHFAIAPLLAE
ncbi:CBM35 domain-containing protein [Glycomyces harbinensis]|uniref:Carbohydrate binding module (Family 35) n=1 Tax=Glycomyces harbinensis TaxID=58114 RepID=A0A1G6ZI64_9ACTN|nr:CBM35 domain-containing protein [Glycomyces harbinensis]SDE01987.1 Carbohydrate binding module (family 35) [Glycomyces harbinensis]